MRKRHNINRTLNVRCFSLTAVATDQQDILGGGGYCFINQELQTVIPQMLQLTEHNFSLKQ